MSGGNRQEKPATVEQVFQSLQTRLYDIQIGDIKKNKEFIWRKQDEENEEYYKNIIRFIIVNFSSFPDSDCLSKVNYCLEKADELKGDVLSVISKVNFSELGLDFPSIVNEKKEKLLNLIGNELGYYSKELKKLKDELESRLKRSGNNNNDISQTEKLSSIKKNEEYINEKHIQSFGFSEKHISKLKEIYNLTFDASHLMNKERTTEKQFIDILTAKDLSVVEGEIYFACETAQAAYILEKMKSLSPKFKYSTIEASGKFFTKNKKPFTANDISASRRKTPSPKEHEKVDSLFKS